jgi:hypothetical protein
MGLRAMTALAEWKAEQGRVWGAASWEDGEPSATARSRA